MGIDQAELREFVGKAIGDVVSALRRATQTPLNLAPETRP
jgi:hypothetical protein